MPSKGFIGKCGNLPKPRALLPVKMPFLSWLTENEEILWL